MTSTAAQRTQPAWTARKNRIGNVQKTRFEARSFEALQPERASRLGELGGRSDTPIGALFMAGEISEREVVAAVEMERRHWMAARVLGASIRTSAGAPDWFAEFPRPMGDAARDCVERYRALSLRLGEVCPPLILRELLGAVLEGLRDGDVGRVRIGLSKLSGVLEGENLC